MINISWVSNLKFLGIISVILGHIASPFTSFLYSWHMPLFFIVAGFFIKKEINFKYFLLKDFKRLMIPYFIFSFVALAVETIKRVLLSREGLEYDQELFGIMLWMDFESLKNTYGFVLWFLPALYLGRFFVYLILKYIDLRSLQLITVLMLFYISFIADLPFALDNALNSVLFVYFGAVFYSSNKEKKMLLLMPLFFIILWTVNGVPELNLSTKYYSSVAVNLSWVLLVFICFYVTLNKLNRVHKYVYLWASNTMLLFIIHPYTNNAAHIIVEKIHSGGWALKFLISAMLLHFLLMLKSKYNDKWIFKYV